MGARIAGAPQGRLYTRELRPLQGLNLADRAVRVGPSKTLFWVLYVRMNQTGTKKSDLRSSFTLQSRSFSNRFWITEVRQLLAEFLF